MEGRYHDFSFAEALEIAKRNDPGEKIPSVSRTLIAEIETLRQDAERYRWLRKHVTDAHAIYRDVNGHLQSFDFDCEGDVDFDAAIDAAMNGANA